MTISQVEKTSLTGQKYTVYQTSLSAPLKTKLVVFKFNGKQFDVSHEVNTENSAIGFNQLAQFISGSASVESPFRPSESDAQKVFDEVFEVSFKDSAIALSTRLKSHREFAISTLVENLEGGKMQLQVGNQEDIRVDHPIIFKRTVDGQEKQVGWGFVRQSGDNCLMLPAEQRSYSQAELIQGQVNEYDLAVEHPWTGVYGRGGVSASDTVLEYKGSETGAGAATFAEIGFIADLGYVLNNPGMSDVWMNVDLGIGSTSDGTYGNETLGADTAARVRLGAEKRYPIAQGLYASAGADIGIEAHNYKLSNVEDPLKISTYNLIPRAELGYFVNPNLKVYGGASYNLPLATTAKEGDVETDDFEMSGGLSLNIGFAMHVDFAGPFAKMTAKPSTRCDLLRKQP
jgi:hypothetical protein